MLSNDASIEFEGPPNRSQADDTEAVSCTEQSAVPAYAPRFTVIILCVIWSFYLWGHIHFHLSNKDVSPPKSTNMWFTAITSYPECNDLRKEAWRLFSNQFCHDGLQHIGFNTLLLLPLAVICEAQSGVLFTALAFEVGILYGTLGFYRTSPYVSIVGCSHGICGIIGSSLSNVILNSSCFPNKGYAYCLSLFYILIILAEVGDYFLNYNSKTAYAAHLFGFIGGLLVGLAAQKIILLAHWKIFLKLSGALAAVGLLSYLLRQYAYIWPPQDFQNSTHCCALLLTNVPNDFSARDGTNPYYRCLL